MSEAVTCPRCHAETRDLKAVVGLYPGKSWVRQVPVGGPLCPPCFDAQGLPERVLLVHESGHGIVPS